MKDDYDMSHAKRGAVIPQEGKTRIILSIDDEILNSFRARSDRSGCGYQAMMNDALREYLNKNREPIEDTLRRVREA